MKGRNGEFIFMIFGGNAILTYYLICLPPTYPAPAHHLTSSSFAAHLYFFRFVEPKKLSDLKALPAVAAIKKLFCLSIYTAAASSNHIHPHCQSRSYSMPTLFLSIQLILSAKESLRLLALLLSEPSFGSEKCC